VKNIIERDAIGEFEAGFTSKRSNTETVFLSICEMLL
jgi:hypothetical protein